MEVAVTQIISTCISAGGMGMLAGVLFFLHITQRKDFKEEMAAERDQYRIDLAEERKLCHDDHERILDSNSKIQESLIRLLERNKQ